MSRAVDVLCHFVVLYRETRTLINYETKLSKAGSTLTTDMIGFPPDAQLQPAQAQGERVLQHELSRTQVTVN